MVKEKIHPADKSDEVLSDVKEIILYNDDFNTFDFVIDTLMDLCKHDLEQAEQCALIVHHKGKCAVKSGSYTELKPICTEMLIRNLTAEIE
ncbi:MAG: ATP-dependent Clp protease adaptor ClpS [Bacteroidetes bacterium]|nr:ATP-dependent Clp protease adaptor ClpS [Bacteroidota bacterium]